MEPKPAPVSPWLPPLALLLLLLHLGFTLLDPSGCLTDPGIGWHLKSGELMVSSHTLPVEDLFSYSLPGHPWINYQWGFHVFLGLLQLAGGLPSVVAVCVLLYALPPFWTMLRMMREGADFLTSLLLGLLVWMVMAQHAYARPHLFSYLFFAVFLDRLARHERAGGAGAWRILLPLPFFMVLWCNLHGGFTAGLALLGIHAGMNLLGALWPGGGVTRDRAFRSWGVFLACTLASLANPYGWNLHRHIVSFLQVDGIQKYHEFLPVWRVHSASTAAFALLALSWIWALWRSRDKTTRAEQAAALFFLFYGISAVRHIVLFALLAAPLIARSVPALSHRLKALAAEQTAARRGMWFWGLLVSVVWLALPWARPDLWPKNLVGLNVGIPAAEKIRELGPALVPVFNSENLGGGLVHEFYPQMKVFVDDRMDYYGADFVFRTYLPVIEGREGWRQTLDRYGVRGVVIKPGTGLGAVLRKDAAWRLVAEDPKTEVFQRLGPLQQPD